ncbi:hypothetical protein B0T22DRAFT_441763 [Podospora appendiculata]|uniref:Uncharacterized protein n=1 Tax=Podospora appendiculata TaxID=314037 RepID=A0AAE1CE29_9PEZI|nr:hypothetical protein B0T22DRAFT_441763 [Podospora appendiculata]
MADHAGPSSSDAVTVQIFSSSLTTLKGVSGVRINTRIGDLFDKILHIILEKSDSILAVGSLNPVLEFRFVPARRTGVSKFWRHPKAISLCKVPMRTGESFLLVGRERGRIDPMYTNIFNTIKASFIASKPPLKRSLPKVNVPIQPALQVLHHTPPEEDMSIATSAAQEHPADGNVMHPEVVIAQAPPSPAEIPSLEVSEEPPAEDDIEPAYVEFIFRLPRPGHGPREGFPGRRITSRPGEQRTGFLSSPHNEPPAPPQSED